MARAPALRVLCPWCLEAGDAVTIAITQVVRGPLDDLLHEALAKPFFLYRCPACRYAEVHDRLLREDLPR